MAELLLQNILNPAIISKNQQGKFKKPVLNGDRSTVRLVFPSLLLHLHASRPPWMVQIRDLWALLPVLFAGKPPAPPNKSVVITCATMVVIMNGGK